MSTVRANNYYDASGGSNAQLFGVASPPNSMGFRNRIINGDMRIDQRNAGASVSLTSGGVFPVDRWKCFEDTDGTMTAEQVQVAPVGFIDSLLFTTGTADSSLSSAQFCAAFQFIEGFNVADLAWGTASASPITISFWVRSSLTGTFGGAVSNSATNRSYAFTYSISSVNTWEQKSITIAGDTSGTWENTNSTGIRLAFGLGVGSSYSGSAGSWAAANYMSATGATSVIGTASATFYITGVQLEAGTNASAFERRPYGTELMLCQRYYWKTYNQSTVPGSASSSATYRARSYSGSYAAAVVQFPVLMRAVPSCTLYNSNTGATNSWRDVDNNADRSASLSTILDNAVCTESSSVTVNTTNMFQIVASAEL